MVSLPFMHELLKETPAEFVPGEMSEDQLRKNLRFVAERDAHILGQFVPVMRDGGGISMMHETEMPNFPRDGALANVPGQTTQPAVSE